MTTGTQLINESDVILIEKPRSELVIIWRNFLKNRGAVIGLAILIAIILLAIFADVIAPFDPYAQQRDLLEAPGGKYYLGTDMLGRDTFSRILFGARISIGVGIGAVLIALVIGTLIGISGGYFGGKVDAVVVMLVDVFMSFPGLLLALVIAALLEPTLRNVMIAVGIGQFTMFARVVRSATLVEKNKGYILASKSIGTSNLRIILTHVLPNIVAPLIVLTTVNIGSAILSAASMGFLGLGAQPPTPEWGNMVNVGRDYLQIAPWLISAPGLAIMITVLAANLLGDGLRDSLDPRLRV